MKKTILASTILTALAAPAMADNAAGDTDIGVRLENGNYATLRLTDGFMTKFCIH